MSRIKGRDTKPEKALRSYLYRAGYRYRVHLKALPGTPDIVFPTQRLAVFVHGCFWHRHRGCRFAYTPETNKNFWKAKFAANVLRDRKALQALRKAGWTPIVIWECQIKQDAAKAAEPVTEALPSPTDDR
jgi:DNA mismatch endonuclease, patch repair protein